MPLIADVAAALIALPRASPRNASFFKSGWWVYPGTRPYTFSYSLSGALP